jgi:hypothetical protein
LSFDRQRVWNVCAALVVLGLGLSFVVQESFHRSHLSATSPGVPMDFPHYYTAGKLAKLKSPNNVLYYPPIGSRAQSYLDLRYDDSTPYGGAKNWGGLPDKAVTRPFDAPPFAALMMEPLAFLPWKTAYFALQLLGIALAAASVYLLLRLSQQNPAPISVFAVVLAMVYLFMPFNRTVAYGNIDVEILFLWVAGIFLLGRQRLLPSALCFALGTAIKITPAFALPLFVMRRQWKWLAWYGICAAAVLGFSVWRVGWENHVLWACQVAPALSGGMKGFYNRSLAGFVFALSGPHTLLQDLPGPKSLRLLNKTLDGACYCAFLFWCWRKRNDAGNFTAEIVLLPVVILLISPLSWPQHYVITVLPLTFLWIRAREPQTGVSNFDLALLAFCTLTFGSALPEFIARALGAPAELLLMAAWVAATVALLWVGVRMPGSWAVVQQPISARLRSGDLTLPLTN